jgi:hypothetical protein
MTSLIRCITYFVTIFVHLLNTGVKSKKSKAIPVTGLTPVGVFPVKHEHHLHIKK